MVALGHIKQCARGVTVVGNHHCLCSFALGDTEVQIAAHVGRQALLSGLQNDHSDFACCLQLSSDSVVEDLLGWFQFGGRNVTSFCADLQGALRVEAEVSIQTLTDLNQLLLGSHRLSLRRHRHRYLVVSLGTPQLYRQ